MRPSVWIFAFSGGGNLKASLRFKRELVIEIGALLEVI